MKILKYLFISIIISINTVDANEIQKKLGIKSIMLGSSLDSLLSDKSIKITCENKIKNYSLIEKNDSYELRKLKDKLKIVINSGGYFSCQTQGTTLLIGDIIIGPYYIEFFDRVAQEITVRIDSKKPKNIESQSDFSLLLDVLNQRFEVPFNMEKICRGGQYRNCRDGTLLNRYSWIRKDGNAVFENTNNYLIISSTVVGMKKKIRESEIIKVENEISELLTKEYNESIINPQQQKRSKLIQDVVKNL